MSSTNKLDAYSVLVVEDEEFSARVIERLLGVLGVGNVIWAGNGKEAIELIESSGEAFDIILCDIMMPEMDGYEFVSYVRDGKVGAFADIPIVMLTGVQTDEDVQRGRMPKVDGFVFKPPKLGDLYDAMASALNL